ncbi:single-strand DNA-binding protein [Sulfobacillus thermosulfidooxidans DSM 9293]|uniref:Single-stranded DNA-binding protein n=1 Tax=Sulfobacillus thermosulfidooxidans (strain DSM 9293 / VKM B-1269 / AT-1) TaxID=929705 RepID=A0A1W1WPB0_SULTA|nr:single-stranded DNA-binding protein [Sulfobacillus thermosulfidooxidans]SMC08147.1 single-strand DNA-binding protein [Sulfobacillus thermosulfidooxidans DSM 9293]
MLNKVILIGRLTRDPELRMLGNGTPVTRFTVAVDRPFTNAQGQREADFIDCVAWRKLGEIVADNLTKGRLIAVEGRLQIRSYEVQDGSKRKAAEVVADTVQFLDSKSKATVPADGSSDELPDELPF